MPHVIIGHTSSDRVHVWVKGDASNTTCEVTLRPPPRDQSQPAPVQLDPGNDYTATVVVPGLEPDLAYEVVATFTPSAARIRGRARTFKEVPASAAAVPFSFVLSSCNLSIVNINDFLARLSATAGAAFAVSSLDIAPYRWRVPKSPVLQSVARPVGKFAIWGVSKLVERATRLKQTGATYLRSPFLKLAAIFESRVLELPLPKKPAPHGRDYAIRLETYMHEKRRLFLATGDRVESSGGATGVVASMSDDDDKGLRRLVIAHVDGTFETSAVLFRCVTDKGKIEKRRLGPISDVRVGRTWYEPPSFFIHAGDQIYYDFPDTDRVPDRREYRLAYREAWFEDEALRCLLAQWPHYMTLDDHELADQYARDFKPPTPDPEYFPDQYLKESTIAYREYAHALNPPRPNGTDAGIGAPAWFTFAKGAAKFFVMDTRTERWNTKGEIIDREQMEALLSWLSEPRDKNALKFVVTSVPFVAELSVTAADEKQDWYDPKRNSEQDKWTAPQFKAQRDEVIEHIHRRRIEHVVFLTGDMHCCYHATMRIGTGVSRYESTVVHELAGGPVNQLQLARVTEFACHRKARTSRDLVDYEVTLERFHGDVSAVMHLKVDYVANRRVHKDAVETVPEVEWNVIRTLTDPGPDGWLGEGPPTEIRTGEAVMGGRISFARRRTTEELLLWP